VVLLHGFLDTADTFQFMVDCFEDDWPLVSFDWRGFGRTQWAPQGYWFPDYSADLDALLPRLCPDGPARLVGHSMGGNLALWYAGLRPDSVRRVVSLEGFGLPRTQVEQAPRRFRQWLDQLRDPPGYGEYASLDEVVHLLVRRNKRLPMERARFIAETWFQRGDDGVVRQVADPAHKLVNPYLYRREEAEQCWSCITAPTLLVLGELSQYWPGLGEDGTDGRFRSIIPGLEIERIAGAGHMMHHESPELVASSVEAFLRRGP
jgi:pimeloyl-ACP methyl ester carboxylesterase